MDIKKYLKNEVEISNGDIDLDKLTADLKKGVEKEVSETFKKQYETDLSAKEKEYTSNLTKLQNDYDSLSAKYNEATNQNKVSNLKVAILSNGFKGDDIDEVAKLRTTMYADIIDDNEALSKVKERYKQVYFDTKVDIAPNEAKMQTTPVEEIKPVITRNTSIKDLMKN